MENSDLVTIIIAIIGTLGGTSAWNFYQKKLELNRETEKDREKQTYLYRDDLRERVAVLESKLDEERQERLLLLTRMQEQSEELAALISGFQSHVNLIAYNPIQGEDFKRPQHQTIKSFMNILERRGISVTLRSSRGLDQNAACGQLRHKHLTNS